MLDAVRVAARWVSRNVLARLSARASVAQPPGRYTLIKDFCRATKWYDRRGELAVSSANVALKRLEQQGLVRLPPPSPRCAPSRPRQLRDDGQALPPLPRLPHSVDQIGRLRLQLLSGQNDPDHLVWNRLITREHPLAGAPLVGAQLRYLIRSDEGILGAFGFGPASPHLQCRDSWIGWDYPTRQANLHLVIGLARFLIRPGVRCSNLASRCYRLVLSQVAQDWQERYGVTPVLVETFVDRSTQTGVSLSAANWRRLGQSSGGGRSRPSLPLRPKAPKDVWVCELTPKAREVLPCRPAPLAPPRSLFHPPGNSSWMAAELDGLALGSVRLERRFLDLLTQRWQHPSQSFGASFQDPAGAKAAYRFVENPQAGVNFQSLLEPHRRQTLRRMAAESVVVLAQDSTTLSYRRKRERALARSLPSGVRGRAGDAADPGGGVRGPGVRYLRTPRSIHCGPEESASLGARRARPAARIGPKPLGRTLERSRRGDPDGPGPPARGAARAHRHPGIALAGD